MKYLDKLLDVYFEDRSIIQIIFWWELRRILYNIIVLLYGIICLITMSAIVNVPPGEDLVEPLMIVGIGILCNLGYSLGWITEIFKKKVIPTGLKCSKLV